MTEHLCIERQTFPPALTRGGDQFQLLDKGTSSGISDKTFKPHCIALVILGIHEAIDILFSFLVPDNSDRIPFLS